MSRLARLKGAFSDACHWVLTIGAHGHRFRGVSKKKGKWEAKVMVDRKWAYRELFDSETEAAVAYDAAVWRLKPREAKSYVNFKDKIPVQDAGVRKPRLQPRRCCSGMQCRTSMNCMQPSGWCLAHVLLPFADSSYVACRCRAYQQPSQSVDQLKCVVMQHQSSDYQ